MSTPSPSARRLPGLAERIQRLRRSRFKTQSEAGRESPWRQQDWSRWESGAGEPDATDIVRLAEFFNVSTDYMLGVLELRLAEGNRLVDLDVLDKLLAAPNHRAAARISQQLEITIPSRSRIYNAEEFEKLLAEQWRRFGHDRSQPG